MRVYMVYAVVEWVDDKHGVIEVDGEYKTREQAKKRLEELSNGGFIYEFECE